MNSRPASFFSEALPSFCRRDVPSPPVSLPRGFTYAMVSKAPEGNCKVYSADTLPSEPATPRSCENNFFTVKMSTAFGSHREEVDDGVHAADGGPDRNVEPHLYGFLLPNPGSAFTMLSTVYSPGSHRSGLRHRLHLHCTLLSPLPKSPPPRALTAISQTPRLGEDGMGHSELGRSNTPRSICRAYLTSFSSRRCGSSNDPSGLAEAAPEVDSGESVCGDARTGSFRLERGRRCARPPPRGHRGAESRPERLKAPNAVAFARFLLRLGCPLDISQGNILSGPLDVLAGRCPRAVIRQAFTINHAIGKQGRVRPLVL